MCVCVYVCKLNQVYYTFIFLNLLRIDDERMASNCLPAFQNEMLQRPAAELTLNSSSTGKHHNDDNCQQQLKTVQEYLDCGQHYQQPLTIDTKTFNNTVDSNQLDVEHIR